jgi:hypothetical protein
MVLEATGDCPGIGVVAPVCSLTRSKCTPEGPRRGGGVTSYHQLNALAQSVMTVVNCIRP